MKRSPPDSSGWPSRSPRIRWASWRIILASGLGLIPPTAVPARAGDAELDRFRKEYPGALERLERAYSECKGECRVSGPADRDDPHLVTNDVRFATSGGYRKTAIAVAPSAGKLDPIEKVYCVGEGQAFSLVKTAERAAFQVAHINEVSTTQAAYDQAIGRFLGAPYSAFILPMSRVLGLPTYRLRSAESFQRGGKSLMRVRLAFGKPETPQPVVLELDPSAGWAVVHSEFYFREGAGSPGIIADIDYGPQVDGIPIPKAVSITDTASAKGAPPRRCEFLRFEFGPTPVDEFKLPHYGLPDIMAGPSRGAVYSHVSWLLGTSSAVIGLGLVLRAVSRRLRVAAA
jgi:hypothetical protein